MYKFSDYGRNNYRHVAKFQFIAFFIIFLLVIIITTILGHSIFNGETSESASVSAAIIHLF